MKKLIMVFLVFAMVFTSVSFALAWDDIDKYLFKVENLNGGWKYEEYYQCKDYGCYEKVKRTVNGNTAGTINLIAGVLPYVKVNLENNTAKWVICESDVPSYFVYMKDEDSTNDYLKFFKFKFDTNVGDLTLNITKADPLTKKGDTTITMPTYFSLDGKIWEGLDKLKWDWFIGKCDQTFEFTIKFKVDYHQPWGVYESNIEFNLSHELFDPEEDFGEPLYSNFIWDWISS